MPTKVYCTQQLQIAIAKELTDLIVYVPFSMDGDKENEPFFHWKEHPQNEVTEREWLWLIQQLELRLGAIEATEYIRHLEMGVKSEFFRINLIRAPWQARAIAFFKTVGIKKLDNYS